MTRSMMWTSVTAIMVIMLVLGVVVLAEPSRQEAAQAEARRTAVESAADTYARNCVICHGSSGGGVGAIPALNQAALRIAGSETLFRTISRGRYNTAMVAWSMDEGGSLTTAQINELVTLIQFGDWEQVSARVAALGLNPPTAIQIEVSQELLASVETLPNGATLSVGLTLFAANCAACHGANAEGTTLAPALDNPQLLTRMTDADLARTIGQGVPGTLMAGWDKKLSAEEITSLATLVRRWDELQAAGIALPAVEVAAAPPTPEMIAAGQKLFSVTCANCHGRSAQGTRMAPALYNKTFLSQTPDAAITQIISNGVPGTAMPAWGGRLTDADLKALVAYLRSLEPTAPPVAAP
jgi:cbb3-type cytochrome c oxidase subunit III